MRDELLLFRDPALSGNTTVTTITATGSGTSTVITQLPQPPQPIPPGGFRNVYAEIFYKAAKTTSGTTTVTFKLQHSPNGTVWYDLAIADAEKVSLTSTPISGQILLRVQTKFPNLRIAHVFGSGGTNPTITYEAGLVLAEA